MSGTPTDKHVTSVYLLRHGRTAFNVSDRLRGRNDLALDTIGLSQAEALGKLFQGIALSHVYASPLQRAVRTATPVALAAGLRVEPMDGFNDRDYGQWTGVERSVVIQRFGTVDAAPGVESWTALCDRVLQTLRRLVAESDSRAIAIVGHDATNRALLSSLVPALSSYPEEILQANGCWNHLERGVNGWSIRILNAMPGDGKLP